MRNKISPEVAALLGAEYAKQCAQARAPKEVFLSPTDRERLTRVSPAASVKMAFQNAQKEDILQGKLF